MGDIIEIRFSEDLPTKAQNALRYALEMGRWRRRVREAKEHGDWRELDRLQLEYERVGLP